jgi:hypothetical protein
MVERTIRQLADSSGYAEQPVIKWMDTPSDAFDHLSQFGLDALLDMGTAGFWRRLRPPVPGDARAFDRAFEVRMTANDLLAVDEQDRLLMTPKLRAKSQAISSNASDAEVFQVRPSLRRSDGWRLRWPTSLPRPFPMWSCCWLREHPKSRRRYIIS